ncbi:hypothetical protein M514_19155 [Trichuris suis]|uniref:Uncharacterized protein n=1 Tax=Trichuris suis TaxID=68888 RepID=A0A085NGW6_9BILA|nr:hypothetical protein M514_19155 [Trichuris suis]
MFILAIRMTIGPKGKKKEWHKWAAQNAAEVNDRLFGILSVRKMGRAEIKWKNMFILAIRMTIGPKGKKKEWHKWAAQKSLRQQTAEKSGPLRREYDVQHCERFNQRKVVRTRPSDSRFTLRPCASRYTERLRNIDQLFATESRRVHFNPCNTGKK